MNIHKAVGGILLISCTTIGGGVLTLPTSTFVGGFIPSTITFIICWFFMTCSALYLLEATLWAKDETNLISMAKHTLGLPGQIFCWLTYMLLLYALICAYLFSASSWLVNILAKNFDIHLGINYALPVFAFTIGMIIFIGIKATDYANRILSIGLIIAYVLLIATVLPFVDVNNFTPYDISVMPKATPLIITTFGFAIVVPTLVYYLNREAKPLRNVIIIGSIIPLLVYILWEFATLGTLSIPGNYGLEALATQQANGTQVAVALEKILAVEHISTIAKLFSIFAIITSLVGVALSLFHFLADGLNVSQSGKSGFSLFILTFIPPLLITMFYPTGFDKILSFSGIFVAIILGLIPAIMVWSGRYRHKFTSEFKLFGGKLLIVINVIFFIYVIFQELHSLNLC